MKHNDEDSRCGLTRDEDLGSVECPLLIVNPVQDLVWERPVQRSVFVDKGQRDRCHQEVDRHEEAGHESLLDLLWISANVKEEI